MSSVLRPVRKRKKGRTLGRSTSSAPDEARRLEVDARWTDPLRPSGLDARGGVAGRQRWLASGTAQVGGRRGSNPGTVGSGRNSRAAASPCSEILAAVYEALQGERAGPAGSGCCTGCRNYEAAAEAIPGAIGLSGSTVSRTLRPVPRSGASSKRGTCPVNLPTH